MLDLVQKVEQYVQANMDRHGLSVGDVAHAVCMSERQFYRDIKACTGLTPYLYIQKLRLQKAKSLALDKVVSSLEELTHAVGYCNVDHFIRLFRNTFGVHPRTLLDS